MLELWGSEQPRVGKPALQLHGATAAPSRSTSSKVTSTTELLAGPSLMTANAAARFFAAPRPYFPAELPGAEGPRTMAPLGVGAAEGRGDAAKGGPGTVLSAPRGCAQRRGGGIAPCSPQSCGPGPAPPPASLPAPLSEPAGRGAAGHGGCAASPCGGCFGTEGGGCAPRGVRPSIHPSIHPSVHPCVGGGSCVCVTDSAARTARGSRPSQPAGATAARRGCGSPFSVPRSPPQWGRPQRPRCSSSSSLLAGQVFQIQERILCHVFVKQPGLYSLWADSGTVLIRSKNNI
ncbi:translation initiation factor IF-2-like [Manacus candei]|uniref:translation initiation factor IF-2-like n=1 Tax=Manacus candei TaxID=415023 RepID=UPI0022278F60|nr:translation initiation factor IF-2-like [Manacus candei]